MHQDQATWLPNSRVIFEETKNMTPEQLLAYYQESHQQLLRGQAELRARLQTAA
jgi:hypothetical protein